MLGGDTMLRKIGLSLFSMLFIFIVLGCSNNVDDSNASNKDNDSNSSEKTTIILWDSQALEPMVDSIEDIIDNYESANPDVEIERSYVPFSDIKDKLLLGSASEELPDIVMLDGPDHQSFAASGVLEDITEEVSE